MTVTAADTTASATASAVVDATDASQPKSASSDRDSHEVKMDLNVEMVAAVEAKVASVRETLGEMAMSEQYMRTKRAQLLARTREREAQLATALAEQKEKKEKLITKYQVCSLTQAYYLSTIFEEHKQMDL